MDYGESMTDRINRRAFLRGSAAVTVAAPLSLSCLTWFERWFNTRTFFDMGRNRPPEEALRYVVTLQQIENGKYKDIRTELRDTPELGGRYPANSGGAGWW